MVSGITLIVCALIMFVLTIISGVQAEDDADWLRTAFAGMLGTLFLCAGIIICCEESKPKEGTIVCSYYDVKSQQTITINEEGDTVVSWLHYIDYKK